MKIKSKNLEEQKFTLTEKVKNRGCLLKPFDNTFRTIHTSQPYTLLEGLKEGSEKMVRPTGIEPATLGSEVLTNPLMIKSD